MIFRTFALGLGLVVLTGCVSETVYHAPGVSLASRDVTLAQCQSQALAAFPIRNQTRQGAPTFVPATQTCDADGNCTRTEAFWEPGRITTVDVNQSFRETEFQGCMGRNGFSRVELPFCEEGTPVVRSTTIPPLSGGTCLLRQRGSEPLIVSPARR